MTQNKQNIQNTQQKTPSQEINKRKPLNGSKLFFADFVSQNHVLIDEVNKPEFLNNLYSFRNEFDNSENYSLINFEENYKFRPDLIALKYYGNDLFYPLVLISNKYSSSLKFVPGPKGSKLKIINLNLLKKIYEKN